MNKQLIAQLTTIIVIPEVRIPGRRSETFAENTTDAIVEPMVSYIGNLFGLELDAFIKYDLDPT